MLGIIRWTAAQTKRLSEAVRKFNATITRLEKTGLYDVLPNRVNLAEEKARIFDRNQLYQRERELNRFLKKNRKDAQEVISIDGVTMPKYLPREFKNVKRSNNKKREELRNTIAPSLAEMSPPEQASYYANKNIMDTGEDYPDDIYDLPDRFDEEINEKYYTDVIYSDNYLSVLEDNYPDIADEIAEIVVRLQNKPGALREVMESPDPEKDIDYLYLDGDLTAYNRKKREIVEYWRGIEARYGL